MLLVGGRQLASWNPWNTDLISTILLSRDALPEICQNLQLVVFTTINPENIKLVQLFVIVDFSCKHTSVTRILVTAMNDPPESGLLHNGITWVAFVHLFCSDLAIGTVAKYEMYWIFVLPHHIKSLALCMGVLCF